MYGVCNKKRRREKGPELEVTGKADEEKLHVVGPVRIAKGPVRRRSCTYIDTYLVGTHGQ
jgi:hypothetical protein